jgi:tripartite ATP-independent transporter DctM subunit
MVAVLFIALIFGIIIGLPVFIVLGISTMAPHFFGDPTVLTTLTRQLFSGLNRFNLLAVPMFVLAGNIMVASGIMDQLLGVANALVGRMRGGLAQINIVVSMLFAGMSGSAVADTVAIGSVMIPAMKKEGYEEGFSGAVTASSSMVGPIIPPSNVMIIYGATFGVPISHLFAAGLFPGVFVGISMMILTLLISIKDKHPKKKGMGFKDFWITMYKGIVPMLMPVIILVGILGGIFTPTEASTVAVGYALIIGVAVYRTLTPAKLYTLLFNTVKTTAGVMLILGFAQNFGWVLARNQIPERILAAVLTITTNKIALLLVLNLFLFIVGLFIGRTVALLILGTMLIPILTELGMHQIHIAMILIFALGVGHLTPPFGELLFTTAYAGNIPIEKILKKVPPYIFLMLAINILVTFVPDFVLFFPREVFGMIE